MIPVLKPNPPSIDKWSKYLQMSYDQAMFSNGGPCVKLLEERLRDFLGLEHTPVLMCNATIALTVALRAMGLEESTVICPSFTFSATPHSIMESGSFPFLVDIGDDLQTDLTALEHEITVLKNNDFCRSMVVVQALGFVCDYKKYEEFAKKHGLKLIFDSAALLGATYNDGAKVGSAGDCEVFSLHITKTFGIGEGALVTSKDKDFLERCRQMTNFGFNKNGESEMYGTNAKCSEMHAAVGLSVLDEIEIKMGWKCLATGYYNHLFKGAPVKTLHQNSAYQVHPLIFESKEIRDKVKDALHLNGIGSRIYYIPIHRQPYFNFASSIPGKFAKTEHYADRILCIPLFETITPEEQELVAKIIKENLS